LIQAYGQELVVISRLLTSISALQRSAHLLSEEHLEEEGRVLLKAMHLSKPCLVRLQLDLSHVYIGKVIIESRIISRQSKGREDCFQKAVIKRGLRRMRRSALRARSFNSA